FAKPTLMDQQPEGGEIREKPLGKNLREVRFDPGRPRQADILAHEAQRDAVADQTPAAVSLGIQVLLQEQGRGPPARAVSELSKTFIYARSPRVIGRCRRDDNWYASTSRSMPDGK